MKKKVLAGLFIFILISTVIAVQGILHHIRENKNSVNQNVIVPIEIPQGVVRFQDSPVDKPILLLFYVDWCTYCRRFMPIFGQAAEKYSDKYTFAYVKCDEYENREIVDDYAIMGSPALFIVDNDLDFRYSLMNSAVVNLENLSGFLDKHLQLKSKLKLKHR